MASDVSKDKRLTGSDVSKDNGVSDRVKGAVKVDQNNNKVQGENVKKEL